MLLISPEECIDCAACEPVCPVVAIFAEEDTPSEFDKFIDLNYEYFGQSRE
jgi:formate hydrogenlyase subunit 6/NADH:ubiquinone oxidoreductase subunit I